MMNWPLLRFLTSGSRPLFFYVEHPHPTDVSRAEMNNKDRKSLALVARLVGQSMDTQGL